jgi:hypothetical protein
MERLAAILEAQLRDARAEVGLYVHSTVHQRDLAGSRREIDVVLSRGIDPSEAFASIEVRHKPELERRLWSWSVDATGVDYL